jgi:hypothetical protein
MRRAADALVARDFEGYKDALAEEFRYEDRRKGLQSAHGKREDLEQARVIADFGLESYDMEVLETRGDLAALYRQTWHLAGFEVVILLVGLADAEGRGLAAIMFDEEELDAARAELEVQSGAR